jgi:hypothetical protein
VQLDGVISLHGEKVDCARTVRKRIVDEIRKGLFDAHRIGGDKCGRGARFDLLSSLARPTCKAFRDCREKLADADRLGTEWKRSLIGSRDQK